LADPERRELFTEIDAVGADHSLRFDAKQMVASQYYFHDISPRFDDGYLGGGQVLPYKEIVTFDDLQTTYYPTHLWAERKKHYRYGLFVDKMEDETLGRGANGRANRPGKRFIVSRTTLIGQFSPIVMIHEMGHTLGLCHPIGTKEPPSPSPTCEGWIKGDVPGCNHYCGVGEDDITAMGDDIDLFNLNIIPWAALGAGVGVLVGVGIGTLFGNPVLGAIIGGAAGTILGGIVGGVLGSDAYQRVVDYHPNEWAALIFNVFQ
jgi:hypothetical protein